MSGLDSLANDKIRLERILEKRDPTPLELDFVKGCGIDQLRGLLSDKAKLFLKGIPNKNDEIDIVTQDFLLEIDRTLSNFSGRASLKFFLVAAFQNRCTTHFNRITKRRKATVSLSDIDVFSGSVKNERPFLDSTDRENQEIQQAFIKQLTPKIQELVETLSREELLILRLRYGEASQRVDWKLIGRIIGCNSDAAKRKRDRMRDRIKRDWIPTVLKDCLVEIKEESVCSQILYMSLIDGQDYESIEAELKLSKGKVKERIKAFSESFISFAAGIIHVYPNDQPAPVQFGTVE